jgi:alkanesulfonate monooxygenase SsuD/methylene tetrahydromethanopterin reductase-like flavin-dependent oxidoreductase (luciferase family)
MAAPTGLLFLGAPAVPEMVSLARRAEAAGFESAWVAETRLTRDAITHDPGVGGDARIPLYVAATGPRAVEYAGDVADGVLLHVCLPVSYVRERRGRLALAAERAGGAGCIGGPGGHVRSGIAARRRATTGRPASICRSWRRWKARSS